MSRTYTNGDAEDVSTSYFVDDRGYSRFEADGDVVSLHRLLATIEHDPTEIDDDTDVHHKIGSQLVGIQLDVPSNIQPIDRAVHQELHASDKSDSSSVEEILETEFGRGE